MSNLDTKIAADEDAEANKETQANSADGQERSNERLENASPDNPDTGSSRQLIPMVLASFLSILWISGGLYLFYAAGKMDEGISFTLMQDLALVVAPVTVFWLIALVFQRTDPLLERRLAMAQTMNRALSPVEEAERRFDQLNKKLRTEVENIDAVVSLATDRIENLEGTFQAQVSELFSATAATEARAVTIKDSLARERESLDEMSDNLASRLSSLEETVNRIAERIEGAGQHSSDTAKQVEARLSSSITEIDSASEILKGKLQGLVERVDTSANSFEQSVDDTELRLQSVAETLLSGMGSFKKDVEGLESRSHEFSETMKEQGHILEQMAEEAADRSTQIESTLKEHIADVRQSANEALDEAERVSAIVADRAQTMSKDLTETLQEAELSATETSDDFAKKVGEALAVSRKLMTEVSEESQRTADQTAAQVDQIHHALLQSTASARETIGTLTEVFAAEGVKVVEEAENASNRTLSQLRQMRANVEDELNSLETLADRGVGRISSQAESISEKARSMAGDLADANANMNDINAQMNDTSHITRERLMTVLSDLSLVEKSLHERQEALIDASRDAGNALGEASERYVEKINEIASTADQSANSIDKSHDKLLDREENLRDLAKAMSGDLSDVTDTLLQSTHSVRAELSKTRTDMSEATDDFETHSAALGASGDRIIAQISSASESLSRETARFKDQSEKAAGSLESAAHAVRTEAEQAERVMADVVTRTKAELSEGLAQVSGDTETRMMSLRNEMEITLNKLLEEYQVNAAQAEKESAHLAMRLGSEAVRITEEADRFIAKAGELDKQLKKSSGENFARTSKLLMQSLSAASVDIHRALSTDIDDKEWQAYLDGDRSRFVRRIAGMADRKMRSRIANQFSQDRDFRETAIRFMRDFEALMERSMDGDRGDALQVTLISSDMGKLYVTLAQALKKLN